MTTIYKYQLKIQDAFTVMLPRRWKPLSIQYQHGVPCLWAAVDTEAEEKAYTFRVYGTGHEIKNIEKLSHIETVQAAAFVWHFFVEGD